MTVNTMHAILAKTCVMHSDKILKVTALSKPYAVEQLSVDVKSHNVDIAAVTETHLKVGFHYPS